MDPITLPSPTNPDWKEILMAKDQQDIYQALPCVRNMQSKEGEVITAWELSDEDMVRLSEMLAGSERPILYFTTLTFGGKFQPVSPSLGVRPEEPWATTGTPDQTM